jgi:hypothetical protein
LDIVEKMISPRRYKAFGENKKSGCRFDGEMRLSAER